MSNYSKVFFFVVLLFTPSLSYSQLRTEIINGDTVLIFKHPQKGLINEVLTIDINKGLANYTYNYSLSNESGAKQNIWLWLIISDSKISAVQSPENWNSLSTGEPNRISWASRNSSFRIKPGEKLEGFSFESEFLPKIKKYYMEGWEQIVLQAGQEPDSIENPSFFDTAKEGYMVFPRDSVIENVLDFTDTLETFRHRSCEELEWATDAGVCVELEEDLSEIRTALVAGDSLSAANALAEFIALVETEKNTSLTSEGYALLYFNAEYLAERLPEPKVGSGITCGCDNPVTQSSGTITLRNGETKCLNTSFSGSVFFESGGTLNVCSTAEFGNVYGNQPGRVNVSETGEVTVGNWNNNSTQDAFSNWGSLAFTNWTTINNGMLTNHGEMEINGGLNQNNGPLVNTGELTVAGSATFNQPGNRNEGTFSAGSLILNSNAELVNECRVESSGPVMINGDFIQQSGGFLRSENRLTVNSGGTLSMLGGQAMAQVNGVMLNGTIESTGINLLVSSAALSFNSGASITSTTEPFYLVAPNLSEVSASFNVADGSPLSIPPSSCNPTGYPSGQ
jgi:hypothetical protein